MQTNVIDLLKKRRSVYNIGKKVEISDEDIATLVKEAVKESPTSFNSQTEMDPVSRTLKKRPYATPDKNCSL